ncbi:hypothetical protein HGRIS_003850 [Hohenbuehelia grisea]|uniref:F-box domain-containing protein n=1 Tax=Hohenbuehelia grisea TaxID=104357 RepID=A0ABR3JGQ2_9AGAR
MHRCLLVPELVNHIIGFISEEISASVRGSDCGQDFERTELDTLARMARTCRAFSVPALNQLWKKLPWFSPLLKLFPKDCWFTQRHYSRTFPNCCRVELLFVQNIQLVREDWERFDYYARRVRSLTVGSKFEPYIIGLASVLEPLHLAAKVPKFPRLRELTWASDYSEFPHLNDFLFRSITHLSLTLFQYRASTTPEDVHNKIWASLPTRCPKITSMHLRKVGIYEPFLPPLKVDISKFKLLRKLSLRTPLPSPEALSLIGDMPFLEALSFNIESHCDAVQHLPLNRPIFGALRDLKIAETTLENIKIVEDFLRKIHRTKLVSLEICTDNHRSDAPASIARLLLAIANFKSLQRLHYTHRTSPAADLWDISLEPILSLGGLLDLKLKLKPVMMDDALIASIVDAFPLLRTLSLQEYSGTSQFTLAGLLPLVIKCRHLEKLSLNNICAATLPNASQLASVASLSPTSGLASLAVGHSIPVNVSTVAAVLAVFFPKLRRITPYLSCADTANSWAEVTKLLKAEYAMQIEDKCIRRVDDRKRRFWCAGEMNLISSIFHLHPQAPLYDERDED